MYLQRVQKVYSKVSPLHSQSPSWIHTGCVWRPRAQGCLYRRNSLNVAVVLARALGYIS